MSDLKDFEDLELDAQIIWKKEVLASDKFGGLLVRTDGTQARIVLHGSSQHLISAALTLMTTYDYFEKYMMTVAAAFLAENPDKVLQFMQAIETSKSLIQIIPENGDETTNG